MKAIQSAACQALAVLFLIAFGVSCASVYEESLTYRLWNNDSFQQFNEPASDPRLALFADSRRGDVLVQYDEIREKDGLTQRRAFFVNANRRRLETGRKPRFVGANAAVGLEPIPILPAGLGQPVPPAGLCVVLDTNLNTFTLHSGGQAGAAVALPTYGTTGGARKTFLTPLTVTGDAVVVGATAGVIAAWAWAHSGFSMSNGR
jgi:hypothetical protein